VTPEAPPAPVGAAEARRRLHPLSPLLHGSKTLMAVVGAISWQGYAQLGFVRWLLTLAAALVLAIGVSAISWAMTGYQVRGRELRVYEGLLWRRTRTIPLDRLQAVDVVRPLMARLSGLAELRLEVIGAHKTEAPLAFLTMSDAVGLRARLLAIAGSARPAPESPDGDEVPASADGTSGDAATTDGAAVAADSGTGVRDRQPVGVAPGAPPPDLPLRAVTNRDVLLSQLMTPQAWFAPIGLVLVSLSYANHPTLTFISVASFLTALVGVLQVPVRRVLDDWNFRIWVDAAAIRLSHGLLDTRHQTIPPARIQAITVTAPLLWRPFGWRRSRMDVAGYGGGQAAIKAGVLLPVADAPTTRQVVGQALSGAAPALVGALIDIEALPLTPPPTRSRWLRPIAAPFLGFALTDAVVAVRTGILRRRLVVVPLARVQSVRVTQGPAQRALRLASVHVDTAGTLQVTGEHRDVSQAYALAAAIADLSRAAREMARLI
jgi:putative membrane protein